MRVIILLMARITTILSVILLFLIVIVSSGPLWLVIAYAGFNENSGYGVIGGLLLLPALIVSATASCITLIRAKSKTWTIKPYYYMASAIPIAFAIFTLAHSSS